MSQHKILCLHGSQTSSEILKLQLGPLMKRLEREQNFAFTFLDGPIETDPHPDLQGGALGPCYRWFTWRGDPLPPSAEDMASVREAYEFLDEAVDELGPFDGVLAFSQGASLAAGYLLDHAVRHPLEPELVRFAILFSSSGLPETAPEEGSKGAAAKKQLLLRVPSLHVCGEADAEWLPKSRELLARCERGSAALVMHKGGHTIPRDRATVDVIYREIEKLLHRAMVF